MKNKKTLALILSLVLVIGIAAGATVAWFTDQTQEVKNTFTVGNIDITLEETDSADADTNPDINSYKMIPGWTITKDPVATVLKNSEDCYLFVKLVKSANFDDFMEYDMADGWIPLDGVNGVYYREVAADTKDQPFHVIDNDTVTVKGDVTKEDMDALEKAGPDAYPTLNIIAYACQLYSGNPDGTPVKFDVADAWALANS